MGKLNEFSIFLNNPQQVYYSGQQIDGTVVVDLNEAMKLRCKYFANSLKKFRTHLSGYLIMIIGGYYNYSLLQQYKFIEV